jgi:lipopolysaccharide export system permease protein
MGILQRYVIGDVLRAFTLALLTMTAIFVLFMVAAQASDIGLSPVDIAHLVPYIIPSTLPYTIPVSLLFAVTVVYGRLAGDNEIIAVKTAGLSVMKVIWPTLFVGACLSALLLHLSAGWIPACTHSAKLVLFRDLEDTFYKLLKRDREFNHPKWPFLIKVQDVQDNVMMYPTFKHKAKVKTPIGDYDGIIQATKATMKFDLPGKVVRVYLQDSESVTYGTKDPDIMLIDDRTLLIPLPSDSQFGMEKRIQEFTNDEIEAELSKFRRLLLLERRKQAMIAGYKFAAGHVDRINWSDINQAFIRHGDWLRQCNSFETERELRNSMAVGSLLFVALGTPIGIFFARRDFLSAFMTCFVPIIIVYYPLMLGGVNWSKEGIMIPQVALWLGNVLLFVGAWFVYPPVIRH